FLRAGREGVREDGVHQGGPYGVLDELVLDLDPRVVRGHGVGRLEPLRTLDLNGETLSACARGVVGPPAPEIVVDEAARARVVRGPSAQERLGLALVDRVDVLVVVVHDLQIRPQAELVQNVTNVPRNLNGV